MAKKPRFEHFDFMFFESSKYDYYVSTKGYVYNRSKKTGQLIKRLKTYIHKRAAVVSIKPLNNPRLKRLVWKAVYGELTEDDHIQCIDGNELNCNIENLRKIPKAEAARIYGPRSRSQTVIVEYRGKKTEYSSVRKAAKALHCSYQTLLDYLTPKKVKKSVLKKWGRRIYYKE